MKLSQEEKTKEISHLLELIPLIIHHMINKNHPVNHLMELKLGSETKMDLLKSKMSHRLKITHHFKVIAIVYNGQKLIINLLQQKHLNTLPLVILITIAPLNLQELAITQDGITPIIISMMFLYEKIMNV